MKHKLLFVILIAVFASQFSLFSQGKIDFEQNHSQYPSKVKYKAGLGSGITMFMEQNCFTYVKYDPNRLEQIHENSHQSENLDTRKDGIVDMHAFRQHFVNANPNVLIYSTGKRPYYNNYYIGNNPANWSSDVECYSMVFYTGLYNGIDLSAYSMNDEFKYDFIVAPNTDPSIIKMYFDHTDGLLIRNNTLVIKLSTGDIVEQTPYSFQEINHVKYSVACEYILSTDGKTVSFHFPNGYNQNYPLTIDPVLIAATYSGAPSSTTTYGHCATYDPSGNIYTGGECFNPGYPTQAGSYQTTFGGTVDIAVSKLDPNGSNLLWSTYIGGSGREIPNSLFAIANGELYVLGATGSANYPTSAGCFDPTHNGSSGADDDIVVTHLNNTGTALIGSTYVGGSANDGGGWGMPWNMNGHDGMRGEIVVDAVGNAWVASFSESPNFPTSPGTFDATLGGTWDAVVFRLNPTCSSLGWSTYLGGSSADGAYALRVNSAGDCFTTGVTCSNDFPTTPGTYDGTYNGGVSDGFITRFTANGNAIIASTYFGSPGNEISYFMDMDSSDNPYIYGVSTGAMPVTPGVYSNANSSNFVSKFDPFLFSLTFSTVFGSGTSSFLEPEAFMVDSCENIYCSGFNSQSNYPVTASTALYPTQASCSNGGCYFIVLSKNALQLSYGSFYYGWHVDGGTSRFDPGGAIYQGICIGSGGAPTPAWAYKNNINAPSWDMYVVKIDFQMAGVNAVAQAAPNDTICENTTMSFTNTSNGSQYFWDFGDGSPIDTNVSPTHLYTTPGSYNVILIAVDSNSCNIADTVLLLITVLSEPTVFIGNDTTICGALNMLLNGTTSGCTYLWNTGATTPTINVTAVGIYWVTVDNGSCTATDSIQILSFLPPDIGSDTSICNGNLILLDAGNPGATYLWNTGATTQTITANITSLYWVDVSSGNCSFRDSINLTVITVLQPNLGNDTSICPGQLVTLTGTGSNVTYQWSTGETDQSIIVDTAGSYWVTISVGPCSASDSVNINFLSYINLGEDISLCDLSAGLILDAGNPSSTYLWNTGETSQTITVNEGGIFWVNITNASQCLLTDTIVVLGDISGSALYLPNCFTPNGDDKNEVFKAESESVISFHMQIFDRWGMLIFESSDIYDGWDGRYKGNMVQQDVYVVKVNYTSLCSGEAEYEKIVHVTVLSKNKR